MFDLAPVDTDRPPDAGTLPSIEALERLVEFAAKVSEAPVKR